eukprot:6531364-Karenia_brevis.AAC.1
MEDGGREEIAASGTIKKIERRARIEQILADFKGLKKIAGLKSCKKKSMITHMRDTHGNIVTDRQAIVDVFAAFYEDLYESKFKVDLLLDASRLQQHDA